jgi:dihydrolipoamide dehydrogenase
MAESAYDCVVIGSGPGGYVAAIRAAQLGMSTAVVEKDKVGGRCLNYACIPAKAVLRVADVLSEVREADEFGIHVSDPTVDFGEVGERRKKVVSTLTGGVAGLMKKNKIDVLEGHGAVTAEGNVTVDGTEITVNKGVILATGSVKKPIPAPTSPSGSSGRRRAGASTSCPRAWRSSARAPRAPSSRRPTPAWAST